MSELPVERLEGYQICHFEYKSILREHRVMLGLTQQEVADRAGVPLQSYQNFELGKRNIMSASFRIAGKVIEALEMDITAFYHGRYTFGEEVIPSKEGLRYKKTGRLVEEDVE